MWSVRPLTLALVAACATASPPPTAQRPAAIHHDALMAHVSVLASDSMEGRLIGTPGSLRARAYLVQAFTTAGLRPFGASLENPVEGTTRDGRVLHGANVVGYIPGRSAASRYLVVSAHYDHVGVRNGEIFNGADDNASGTAALIELARWFRDNPLEHTIIIAAVSYTHLTLPTNREV